MSGCFHSHCMVLVPSWHGSNDGWSRGILTQTLCLTAAPPACYRSALVFGQNLFDQPTLLPNQLAGLVCCWTELCILFSCWPKDLLAWINSGRWKPPPNQKFCLNCLCKNQPCALLGWPRPTLAQTASWPRGDLYHTLQWPTWELLLFLALAPAMTTTMTMMTTPQRQQHLRRCSNGCDTKLVRNSCNLKWLKTTNKEEHGRFYCGSVKMPMSTGNEEYFNYSKSESQETMHRISCINQDSFVNLYSLTLFVKKSFYNQSYTISC